MSNHPACQSDRLITRREILQRASSGLGMLAFGAMATEAAASEGAFSNPLAVRQGHFPGKAKRVIMLWQGGGPPHQDTFDPKPILRTKHGSETKEFASILGEKFKNSKRKLVGSPWKFQKYGNSGIEIAETFKNLAEHVDDICFIRSMHGDFPGHGEGTRQLHTGAGVFTRPSLGAWTVYGLGSENKNLPGFIALGVNKGGTTGSAFLPAVYAGTQVSVDGRDRKGTIQHLQNRIVSRGMQRSQIDLIQKMNRGLIERTSRDAKIDGIIDNYEIAFRMQEVAPEILDFTKESPETLKMYGLDGDDYGASNVAAKCLMARRLAEAGVRFIEIGMQSSDAHSKLKEGYGKASRYNDKPAAALIKDLKQRGMLDDTLIICGGEFGRTPDTGGTELDGRDHNHRAFTYWLAGGGVKGGTVHGQTDDLGYAAVADKVHVHDLHATILHLLGFDHERLNYRHSGRDFRLTNISGEVVKGILA